MEQNPTNSDNEPRLLGEGLDEVYDEIVARGIATVEVEQARQNLFMAQRAQENGEQVSDADLTAAHTAVVDAEDRRRKKFPPSRP